ETAVEITHWGKRTLAYPVSGKESGYYVVTKFEAAATMLPEFERALKLDEGLLRHLVVLDEGAQMAPTPSAKDGEEDEEWPAHKRVAPSAKLACAWWISRTSDC